MRFLTQEECREWYTGWGFKLDEKGCPTRPSIEHYSSHLSIPSKHSQLTWFCQFLEQSLQPRKQCLLWVTDWGIWQENLHLYYRLRQSYGDFRLLHEAPGHVFLDYEGADITSFLQVMILCGWDVHLQPSSDGYARAFVSHDEFVEFASDDHNASLVSEFEKGLVDKNPKDMG